jgi:hypothetical protein
MKAVLTMIAISALTIGCAHRPVELMEDSFVMLDCVVQKFEPEALVFYDPDGLPYDARSRVSQILIVAPASLAGRSYSIDLLRPEDKKDVGFEDLCRPGAVVRFMMPASLTTNSEKQVIPVYMLKKILKWGQVSPCPHHRASRRKVARRNLTP